MRRLAALIVTATAPFIAAAQDGRVDGTLHVHALRIAYPDRVQQIPLRDGEWLLRVGGADFRWARGRLLPVAHLGDAEEFTSFRFYEDYRAGAPTRFAVAAELEALLRERTERDVADAPPRHPGFSDALYGAADRRRAERMMEKVDFLDRTVWVHPLLVDPLARVEGEVLQAAGRDPEVAGFVDGLRVVAGFTWRPIAGTQSRSYHSYGAAIDLVPRDYRRKFAYWRWAANAGLDEWWDVELEDRWLVPQPIVDAFERHGFVWGGKWLFFDNVHFEYRPEVFLINPRARPSVAWPSVPSPGADEPAP